MGTDITRSDFTDSDYRNFSLRLRENLHALKQLLADPTFGSGEKSFGAELELYLATNEGNPVHANQEILESLQDPLLTLELNRYNLEYNFNPYLLKDDCLQKTEAEALQAIQKIQDEADKTNTKVIPVGILPTLLQTDVGYHAMTKITRYEALTKQLRAIRGGPFDINIDGEEPMRISMHDVTLEGACTSFQVHLRTSASEFANTYNALQLITPLATALCANSPFLFGQRLWHETRIPLFKQSIDCRKPDPLHPIPARVNFGHSWLRHGAEELFAECALLYQPILPICSDENPLTVLKNGGTPKLSELRLQQGSVWLWNRPVFDPADGGHLRIEMRTLPAGPSAVDMMANAALLIGLTEIFKSKIDELLPAIPFEYCNKNFYRAAEKGLNAELIWPSLKQNQPEYRLVTDILKELFPMLPDAMAKAGLSVSDCNYAMHVLEERLATRVTGAIWQRNRLAYWENSEPRRVALQAMLRDYIDNSQSNLPVARWKN